jgi:hypothetical protein
MHRSTYGRRQRFQIHLDPLRVGGFLLLMLSSFAQAAAADPSQIAIEVSTNRDRYLPGEWVRATVTKCNPTPDPITVILNCPCCHDRLTVLGSDGATVAATGFGCIQVVVFVTWEPGECKAESYSWYQTAPSFQIGDQVAAGRYRLRHVWEFPSSTTTTTSEELTIDSGAAPQVGAFIDFETLPGGSPVPEGEVGSWYLSRNVRFHELGYGYRQPGFQNGDGSDGNFAQSNVTTYPSGFNIVAEYSVPVGYVAADVMTAPAAGFAVTMTAFDAGGQLVATVESASPADWWKGRLTLQSPGGIARVEWFPSLPQATVGIDNLEYGPLPSVEVPTLDAPGGAVLALLLLALGWRALRRPPGSYSEKAAARHR